MKKYIYILILVTVVSYSQEKSLKKADKKFKQEQYIDAIKIYEQLAKKGVSSIELFQRLGDANYFNANYENAFVWYNKLYELNPNCSSEYLFRYSQCLKSTGDYDKANTILSYFSKKEKGELRAELFNKFNGKANTDENLSSTFNIINLGINSKKSDFGGNLLGDTLVFSSARSQVTGNIINKRTRQSYTNLYFTTIKSLIDIPEPKLFSKKIYTKFNESTPAFSKNGKTMYFTQTEIDKNNNGKAENKGSFKIYKSEFINGNWSTPVKIQIEADELSKIAHPALSPDEKYLYFASDMTGTFGASDIFKIKINEDGTYGKPENLGSKINTEGRESYPYLTNDNKLLFASDGYPGYGGFDIYVLDLDNPYALPINLGTKINSPMDDFAMVWNRETRLGIFSSNRKGGAGDDDIYLIEEVVPFVFEIEVQVKGTLKDIANSSNLEGTKVMLLDNNENIIATTISDQKGMFLFKPIKSNRTYKIKIQKEGYDTQQKSITVSQYDNQIDIPFSLNPKIAKIDTGVDIANVIKFNQIYFDLDKSNIRKDAKVELEKIVEVLKTYPKIKIEIGSHTDARQHRKYNKTLSQKRADTTLKYLVNKGISKDRLTAKGYGESQPVNNCIDGIICSDKEHQQNRRSTFIIIN
jgi:outer membrane protein OmpA-like peptidoglycan-associated protein/tetratricopeptide (TPR) repeat protein